MAAPTGPGVAGWSEDQGPPVVPDAERSPRLRTTVARVGVVAIAVKLLTAVKDLGVARVFGTSGELDVFLLAFSLSQVAMVVVAGSFSSAFVPSYVEAREHDGRDAANRLFEGSFADGLRVLAGAAVVLAIAGPLLLLVLVDDAPGATAGLAVLLFFLLLPTLLMNGASVAWAAVLGAEERYTTSVVPQLIAPIIPLAAVIAMSQGEPSAVALAVATSIGFALEAVATGALLRRAGVRIWPKRLPPDARRRTVVNQFLPVAAGSLFLGSTLLIDPAMAVQYGEGSVAALSFGSKAAAFTTSVGSLALSTAALPHFSKVAALGTRAELMGGLRHWLRITLLVSVPATIVLIVLSEPMVRLVFQHGAFTAEDTKVVTEVQQLFLLQLPAYLVSIVIVRVISTLKANVILLWGSVVSLVVNIGGNMLLGSWLGVAGIALSTSLVYLASAVFLGLMLLRQLPKGGAMLPPSASDPAAGTP